MHHFRKVTDDLYWVGANDRRRALYFLHAGMTVDL